MAPTGFRKEKSNMAARRPFWKWSHWKSKGSYPYTQVLCYWSLELTTEKYNRAARQPFWKWRHWKSISVLLPIDTINMHMKFEIEIPKQTRLMLRKPCCLQTDGQMDGWTRLIQFTPSKFIGWGYKKIFKSWNFRIKINNMWHTCWSWLIKCVKMIWIPATDRQMDGGQDETSIPPPLSTSLKRGLW